MLQTKKRKSRFNSLVPPNKGYGPKNAKGLLKHNFISKKKQQEFFDTSLNKNENINLNDGNDYSKEEKKIIKDTEEEIRRARGFKLLFPNENMLYYEQFFEEKRKINEVLAKALFGTSSKGHPARVQRMRKAGDFIFKSKVIRRESGKVNKQINE